MNKLNRTLITIFTIVIGILLGIFLLGLSDNKGTSNIFDNALDIKMTQDVFEYGEGYIMIPIYKYVENTDDFYSLETDPITVHNKDIGIHDVIFKVTPKNKKESYTIVKQIEIKDSTPAKIYANYNYNPNVIKSAAGTVVDPVDGLLDYKEHLEDTDRGYYTVYEKDGEIVIKAIDKNGNISNVFIDKITNESNHSNVINDVPQYNSGCQLATGFDNVYYYTQEQAIEAAREYFALYQSQSNSPKSFNVSVTSCNDIVYYIWDFIW